MVGEEKVVRGPRRADLPQLIVSLLFILRKWGDQDGGESTVGWTIPGSSDTDWVRVEWPSGDENNYRAGPSSFDLVVAKLAC